MRMAYPAASRHPSKEGTGGSRFLDMIEIIETIEYEYQQ